MKIDALEIAEAVRGKLLTSNKKVVVSHIATDNRRVENGSIFVPIIGAKVDGHTFIENALDAGASASFTSKELPEELISKADKENKALIAVGDTVEALQELGRYYRLKYVGIPYIGITGSVGKTTTREMIACALSAELNTYSTKGNANSQTGVPITVSETPSDARIGVIEMGMSEPGEMTRLARVVNCSMAVMTIIGISHIANLGSQENIMKEKLHITDCMPDGAKLFLNGDDALLNKLSLEKLHEMGYCEGRSIDIKFYGTGDNAYYRAVNVNEAADGTEYDFLVSGKSVTHVKLSVPGMHMVLNSLAALACAMENGVDIKKAAEKLSAFKNLDGRGQITEREGIKIINDAYNAAPQSMNAGLRVLDQTAPSGNGKRIAVIADMLELGPDEARYHAETGDFIVNETKNIDTVLMYGELSKNTFNRIKELSANSKSICEATDECSYEASFNGRKVEIKYFDRLDLLKAELLNIKKQGDVIFFKGSNSMKLWSLAAEMIGE